jgi:hypothetical protein
MKRPHQTLNREKGSSLSTQVNMTLKQFRQSSAWTCDLADHALRARFSFIDLEAALKELSVIAKRHSLHQDQVGQIDDVLMVADELNKAMEESRAPAIETVRQTRAILDCLEIRVYSLVSLLREAVEENDAYEITPEEILAEQ